LITQNWKVVNLKIMLLEKLIQHEVWEGEGSSDEGSSGASEKPGMKGVQDLDMKALRDPKDAPKLVIGINDERGA
jgi:hypothetical protein